MKIENEELRERNSTLFSPEVEIRDREIEKWKAKNQQLFDEVRRLSALNTDLEGISKFRQMIKIIHFQSEKWRT